MPRSATMKPSCERRKNALSSPTACMSMARSTSASPPQDGRPRLATSASRRIQMSHNAMTGMKKPWLYSSCAIQRRTNSARAPWKGATAMITTASATKPTRIARARSTRMTCTDITHPHAKADSQHLAAETLFEIVGMLRYGLARHRAQADHCHDPAGSDFQAQALRPERTSCPVLKLRNKTEMD